MREDESLLLNSLMLCPSERRRRYFRLIDLLARQHVLLKEPCTKQIRGKLRELRVVDAVGKIRVLYLAHTGKRFILLHGFVKKTGKTPSREIDIAEQRMQDYLKQHGGGET